MSDQVSILVGQREMWSDVIIIYSGSLFEILIFLSLFTYYLVKEFVRKKVKILSDMGRF